MTADLDTLYSWSQADDEPRDTVAWSIFDSEDDCPANVAGEPDDGPSCVHGPVSFDWLHVYDDAAGNRWWTNRFVILRQDVLDQDLHLSDLTVLVDELDGGTNKKRPNPIAVVSRLDPASGGKLLAELATADPAQKTTGPTASHFYIGRLAPLVVAGLDVDALPLIKNRPEVSSPMAHVIWRGDDPVGLIMPVREAKCPFHVNELRPEVRDTYARLREHSHLPALLAWHYAAIANSPETGEADG